MATLRQYVRELLRLVVKINAKSNRTLNVLAVDVDERGALVQQRPYSEIPGPKPIPLLGNTWRFLPYLGNYDIKAIDKVSKTLHAQYGDIVKIEGLLGRPDMVFIYDANEIERMFRREEKMPYRPSMPSLDYYKHVHRKDFFQDNLGVIAVHGESWYNFRSKVQQVMLQPRIARMYVGAIEEASTALLRRPSSEQSGLTKNDENEKTKSRISKIRDEKYEVPEDFLNEMHKWSLESIARVALDVRLGCLDGDANADTQRLIDALITFFKLVPVLELKIPFWKLFSTPTWRKYVNALDTIVSTISKYTAAGLSRTESNVESDKELSLLERVLAREGDTKVASILALDLFLVGVDTTSTSVASVLYQLARHPEKQARAYKEICDVLPQRDMPLEATNIDNLKYLKACIKETLRMYPTVISNGRTTTSDTAISGYHVPKGVQVVFQHYVTSNLEKYFPRSREFLPERWLREDDTRHGFASLPFGYGRRMCLGRRFAELEMIIVISKILQFYRIEYHYEELDYYINPMYTPKGPLKLRFIDRYNDSYGS